MYQHLFVRRILWAASTCLVGAVMLFGAVATVSAACGNLDQQSCSASYGVNEVFFGTGGQLCVPGSVGFSTNYCAKSAAGGLGVGTETGSSYKAQAGFNTNREPTLTLIVNSTNIALGALTAGTTASATATFSVETYLSGGYIVSTVGAPPQNGTYTIQTPSSPTTSNTSAEQFGINLVANSSCGGGMPASLGANPVQVPNSTFSFGVAAHNSGTDYYDQACKFMYSNNDTIADSTKSSGETDYTISYIVNTTGATPGGTYSFNQVLVATGTF